MSDEKPLCYRCCSPLRWSKPTMQRVGVKGPKDYDDPTEVTYHRSCYVKALEMHAYCRKFLTSDEAKRIGRHLGGQKETTDA